MKKHIKVINSQTGIVKLQSKEAVQAYSSLVHKPEPKPLRVIPTDPGCGRIQ